MDTFHPRELSPYIKRALKSMPVVVVTGMRQVGKSTLLQHDPELSQRRYFSLDDFATMEGATRAPNSLVDTHETVTVDEVQRAPQLFQAIKAAVDKDRRPGRFLLSGSANLLLMERVTESLAGRALYLTLQPFSKRELAGGVENPVLMELLESGLLPERKVPTFTLDEVLAGGMPSIVLDGADPHIWFQGFEQTYLERDIRALSQVADLPSFQRFLRLTALRTGGLLNISQLSVDASLATSTGARYLGLLETSFSIFRIPPYLKNAKARQGKSSKLYVADSGLANFLMGPRQAPGTHTDPYRGALVETWAATNLSAILRAWRPRATLCFWNIQGRYEVDFVIDDGNRSLAIEVKAGSQWAQKDLRSLRKFLDLHPHCIAGLLACDIANPIQLGHRLYAIPLGYLLT
jgi:uncharacterized protein